MWLRTGCYGNAEDPVAVDGAQGGHTARRQVADGAEGMLQQVAQRRQEIEELAVQRRVARRAHHLEDLKALDQVLAFR